MHSVSESPVVIVTEYLDQAAIDWLAGRARVIRCRFDAADFYPRLADADGVVIRTYTRIDQDFLDQAPRLQVVGRAGVGLDNVDLVACAARGVKVCHTPDANTQAVVEYVTAQIADALRPRAALERSVSSEQWGHLREGALVSRQMSEMTLGILGLGRIGRRLAEVARAIGFEVIFSDLEPKESFATSVTTEELFSRSDVITVHIDGRPENRRFISTDLLARMKSNVLLLNTARGFVLDQTALAECLRDRPGALAILDVHEPEPVPPENPLLRLDNAILYPHLASRTLAAQAAMSWVVRDVARVLGVELPNRDGAV